MKKFLICHLVLKTFIALGFCLSLIACAPSYKDLTELNKNEELLGCWGACCARTLPIPNCDIKPYNIYNISEIVDKTDWDEVGNKEALQEVLNRYKNEIMDIIDSPWAQHMYGVIFHRDDAIQTLAKGIVVNKRLRAPISTKQKAKLKQQKSVSKAFIIKIENGDKDALVKANKFIYDLVVASVEDYGISCKIDGSSVFNQNVFIENLKYKANAYLQDDDDKAMAEALMMHLGSVGRFIATEKWHNINGLTSDRTMRSCLIEVYYYNVEQKIYKTGVFTNAFGNFSVIVNYK